MVAIVKYGLVLLLALEALNTLLWASTIVSAAAAYDAVTLALVAARVVVATLQLSSAVMLARSALPAVTFARVAFVASAILLVPEIGFGLAPSSVPPWLRWQVVASYAVYAGVCVALTEIVKRRGP